MVINNTIRVTKVIALDVSKNSTRIEDHLYPVFYNVDIFSIDELTNS